MPVNLPDYGFSAFDVPPDLGIASERSEGGIVITSRRSDPFLSGRVSSRDLQPAEHADLEAFLIKCIDENMLVDMPYPRRRVPVGYTVDTWPMAGNGSLVGVTNLRTITVSGINTGIVLRRGSRLSLVQGAAISHRWIGETVTVASTISQALSLTPRLPIGVFAPGAVVMLKDPKMRVRIVPGTLETAVTVDRLQKISFEVEEALR